MAVAGNSLSGGNSPDPVVDLAVAIVAQAVKDAIRPNTPHVHRFSALAFLTDGAGGLCDLLGVDGDRLLSYGRLSQGDQ